MQGIRDIRTIHGHIQCVYTVRLIRIRIIIKVCGCKRGSTKMRSFVSNICILN